MADKPHKKVNPVHDLLWLLGIFAIMFFLWVSNGGPERAKENPPSPTINGPVGGGSQN